MTLLLLCIMLILENKFLSTCTPPHSSFPPPSLPPPPPLNPLRCTYAASTAAAALVERGLFVLLLLLLLLIAAHGAGRARGRAQPPSPAFPLYNANREAAWYVSHPQSARYRPLATGLISDTPPTGFAHCKEAASAPLAVASWLALALALPSLFAVFSIQYPRHNRSTNKIIIKTPNRYPY